MNDGGYICTVEQAEEIAKYILFMTVYHFQPGRPTKEASTDKQASRAETQGS
jgi:hypothetical protein